MSLCSDSGCSLAISPDWSLSVGYFCPPRVNLSESILKLICMQSSCWTVCSSDDLGSGHLLGSPSPLGLASTTLWMEIWSTASSRKSWIKDLPWTCQGIHLQCRRPEFDPWIQKITWRSVRHSSILAWRIPWTEKSVELQSTGSHRIRHKWSDWALTLLPYFPHIMRLILPPTAWDCPDQSTWAFPGHFRMWLSLWS